MTALSRGQQPGPEASIAKIVVASKLQELCAFAMELEGEAGSAQGRGCARARCFPARLDERARTAHRGRHRRDPPQHHRGNGSLVCRRISAWTRTCRSTRCREHGERVVSRAVADPFALHSGLRDRSCDRFVRGLRPHARRNRALVIDERAVSAPASCNNCPRAKPNLYDEVVLPEGTNSFHVTILCD